MITSKAKAGGNSIFGDSPNTWPIDRIRDHLGAIVGGEWGDDPDAHDEGVEIPVIRVADIRGLAVKTEDLTIRRVKKSKLSGRLIGQRTVLIEKSGGGEQTPVGRAVLGRNLSFDAICSNFMAKTECGPTLDPLFAVYLLDASYSVGINGAHIQQTTGIQNLRVFDYLNTHVAVPPLPEQQRIAAYLDASCAAINAAVTAKRRQLEVLDAFKGSIIFHAVTKGLNPADPLKPSGIDWLGKVPAHWKLRRIKDIALLRSGDFIAAEDISVTGDYPVYGGNGIRGYTSTFNHNGNFTLIGRQGALCGNINYAEGKFWATEHAVVVALPGWYDRLWFGELLRVMNLNQYSNAAAQPGLAVDRIKLLKLPVPPLKERAQISRYIESELNQIKKTVAVLELQIATLMAYRKSLIHECVTGQRRVTGADINQVKANG
jgi:type I restriction enzyme S subunit